MKIPLSLLKEYVSIPFSPEEIAKTLTLAGLEVDAITSVGGDFSGVVVGKVLEATQHPNADRLKVAKVYDGQEIFQVVCGASNCREGLTVAFAKIGATLKDEQGKPWKIKKGKIRDVESFGMLCSSDELSLGYTSEGILELPSSLKEGDDLAHFYADTLFDISFTPNLGHCMSVYGVARELSIFFRTPLKKISFKEVEALTQTDFVHVDIEDKTLCKRYASRLVTQVKIAPSPSWLVQALTLLNVKSVNNVIDISNYVLMLTGQPLHFFDYDTLTEKKLCVSPLKEIRKIKTLDGQERTLAKDTLVIQDSKQILAIAGVLGGEFSSISEKTTNVLIEAAHFDPICIRKTGKTLGLKTEASIHFERGIDIESIPLALNLAAELLQQVAAGTPSTQILDLYPAPAAPKKILCRVQRVNALLGLSLSFSEVKELLERLYFTVLHEGKDSLTVSIPSFRNDIQEEIDVIEEIAKLYGFNHIPKTPALHVSSSLLHSPIFRAENKARDALLQEGLQEFLTCDLISPFLCDLTKEKSDHVSNAISVLQCKSSDYSILRSSLLPGLLQLVKYNFDHQNQNISGFEVGRIHFKQEAAFQEKTSIGVILSGNISPHHQDPKPREVDFFDLKGMIENLLNRFKIPTVTFEISHLHNFQPGRQARLKLNDLYIGVIGEIHPSTLSKLDIPQRVYFAELNLEELMHLAPEKIAVQELSIMPSSERDWTVTLRKETPIEEVLSCLRNFAPPLLETVFLLDVFESEKMGLDRKNATFRFVYRDHSKTIQFETVESEQAKLIQNVAKKLEYCIV